MTDRELLELAAKAAEIPHSLCPDGLVFIPSYDHPAGRVWDPLVNDGDAMRLVVKLEMCLEGFPLDGGADVHYCVRGFGKEILERSETGDYMAAARRAIVRAAAEIGKEQS